MLPPSARRQLLQRLAHRAHPPLTRTLSSRCACQPLHQRPPRRPPAPAPVTLLLRTLSTSPRLHNTVAPQPPSASPPPTDPVSTSRPVPPLPPPTPPPPRPRRRRRWVSAAILLLLGALSGTIVRVALVPPPPPPPGSQSDLALRQSVEKLALKLPIVQKLLADPEWTHHEAYAVFPPDAKPKRITTGPLGSASGIGAYQHIFHHAPTSTVLDVVYFGSSTVGWPGVVHGGLIATLLDEHTARAAMAEPSLRARGKGVLTARLELQYKRPTLAADFYILKARALGEDELEDKERGKRDRKVWVDVSLETMDGRECVSGRALFVIPKGHDLKGVPEGF